MSPARTIVSASWPVVLSLAAGLAPPPATAGAQAPPTAGAAAAEPARPLAAGETVERAIAPGQAQAYVLRLETGQFFHVALVQKSIDVSLALVGADGKPSREADFSEGPQGREALSLIIESTGDFRLEVRSKGLAIGEGRYALTVDTPRSPGPAERDRVTAEELLSEGARLHKEGRAESYRQAIAMLDKALPLWRSLDEPFFEALCLFRKGAAQRQLGEYHQARDLYTEALSRWRDLGERLFEARALDALGTTYFFLNENEKALDHYLQALALRRAAGDREGEAASLLNVSVGYGALGQLRTSVSWQQQALAQLRVLGDRRREATLLHNMAVVYFRTGRLQKALDHLEEALAMSRAVGDRAQEAATLGTLAVVYGALGEPQDALQRYRQSLDLWRALGQRSGEATTLTEMGRVHASLGETETALEYYRQALALRRAMQDRKEAGTLLSMGMAYKDLGDLSKAADVLAEGLRLAQETKDVLTEASLLSGLGQVYAAQGEAPKAMGHLEQALAIRQRLNDRAEQAAVLYELARVDLSLGQVPRARERLEAALGLIEGVRDEVASHELRAALVARSGQVHDLYLDVLMREHGQDPSAGFEARAFEASERSRVQSLLELLAESHADLREGADPALLEREASLQEQLRFRLERQMRLLTGPHTEEQVAAADAEVRAIRSDYNRLQGQIRADSPRYAALRQPQVLTLRDVQERVLDPQTLLLEYSLGDERSFLFAVGSGTLRSYTLPGRREIEAAARRAYSLLSQRRVGGAQAELAEALASLSRMLLEPVAGEMGGKRLLVVLEGDLQYVPFGALPAPGRPSVALIAEHEVVAVPSASLLAALREEAAARKRPPKTLAVFADPVFDGHDERVRGRPDGRTAAKTTRGDGDPPVGDLTRAAAQIGLDVDVLPRLPYTRREAEAILALAPRRETRAALGFEATLKTALSGELNEYRLVHFATHGFFNNTNPEMSGLVLSLVDAEGKSQEGFLSAGEVFNLRLSADLVVLSGCRTALGKQMKGEGVVGLTRAFMYAGTSRVLASLWSVDDAATATLMTRFYEGVLAGGLTPARALQRAQLAVAGQRQWRHPYYWAGFQLQGDWK